MTSPDLARRLFPTCPAGSEDNLLIRAYLEDLANHVGSRTTSVERDSFVAEAGVHLVQSTRMRMESGQTELEAVRAALARFGDAKTNADDFVTSWYENVNPTAWSKRFGRGNLTAFALFQLAEAICLLILQLDVFAPDEARYRLPISPAQVRAVWPEPLPFPDLSPRFFVLMATPVLLPILTGWLVGKLVPARAHIATYHGLIPLVLCTFVVGALLLPATEPLLFALFQIAFWLPVGCLTAFLSSKSSRGWRRRDKNPHRAVSQLPGILHDYHANP